MPQSILKQYRFNMTCSVFELEIQSFKLIKLKILVIKMNICRRICTPLVISHTCMFMSIHDFITVYFTCS